MVNIYNKEWDKNLLASLTEQTAIPVITDAQVKDSFSRDFGNIVKSQVSAVISPSDVSQLQKAVNFANNNNLQFTIRGLGQSQSGQSLPKNSVSLDTSRFDKVLFIDNNTIECESGVRFRSLVSATSSHRLIPNVLPLNLDLTVGGVLSIGGVGTNSFSMGPVVSNVIELEAVTGQGNIEKCSPENNPELFNALLGGLGNYGVITKAKLTLRKVKPLVRTFYLLYDSIEMWFQDQLKLSKENRFTYLEAFCSSSLQGLRNTPNGRRPFAQWFYGLQVTMEFESSEQLNNNKILEDLNYYKLTHFEDDDTFNFSKRYDPRFEALVRTGAIQQIHPWIESLMPLKALKNILPEVLEKIPMWLGDYHRLILVKKHQLPTLFSVPEDEEIGCFAILPMGSAPALNNDTLKALTMIHQILTEAGGKRYISGWLSMMGREDWQNHYQGKYKELSYLKKKFDPNNVFTSIVLEKIN